MYLLYANAQQFRSAQQINSVLVVAASEVDAVAAAKAAAPYGGLVNLIDHWEVVEIADGTAIGDGTKSVVWFQGRGPVSLIGLDSGGNAIS